MAVVHANEQTTAAEDSGRRQQWDRASYKKELRRFRVRLESSHSGHSAPRERDTPSNDGAPMCSVSMVRFFVPSSVKKMLPLHCRVGTAAAIRQIARTQTKKIGTEKKPDSFSYSNQPELCGYLIF